ncbi:Glutathione reductase [Diplonema papillatum]|nr:Glutathione reductase [Diplonema papillatum]
MSGYMYDLLVIGGGSGGVRASRWAAQQLSKPKVGLVELPFTPEKGGLGGTCVLRGCVPKKLLWYGGHYGHDFHDSEGYGWRPGKIEHEWKPLMEKKRAEMSRLNGIYSNILKNANVEVMEGFGKVVDKHTVQIGDKKVTAGTILIATGAKPHMIDFPGKEYAISSDELLNIEERPAKMVVFGAGYIACEMACILAGYRTEAHVVYRAEHPLRGFDNDCRKFVAEQMEVNGVHLHPSRVPVSIEAKDKKYSVTIKSNKDGSTEVITDVDVVLMATGRAPNVDGLGLEQVGVEMSDDKSIKVNAISQTNIESIYAIGDVTNRMQLTPVALYEGMCFANTVYGGKRQEPKYENVPSAVFTMPPMGVCGLTEEDAVAEYKDVDVYMSSFRTMVHTLSGSKERSMMKMIVDPKTDKVLGIHIVGKDASEVIQGFGAAMKCDATKAQLDSTIGVHPSSAEELVTMRSATRRVRKGAGSAKL